MPVVEAEGRGFLIFEPIDCIFLMRRRQSIFVDTKILINFIRVRANLILNPILS